MDEPKKANLDDPWPAKLLLDKICFRVRVRNRVEDYLKEHNIDYLSWRELMDLFLPAATDPPFDDVSLFWMRIPMLKQYQFGKYLYDSALLTLTEADFGQEFKTEWAMRICRMMLYELRNKPTNKNIRHSA